MNSQLVFGFVAVGFLGLASVLAWQIVLTLRQARSTALALEQFLNGTRPRIEEASGKLSALIDRADRILTSAEQERGTVGAILGTVVHAFQGWRSGVEVISAVAAMVGGVVQAWASMTRPRAEPEPAPSGGTSHE